MRPLEIFPLGDAGVVLIHSKKIGDERGYFMEGWHHSAYEAHGLKLNFAQMNVSSSRRGVVRGLHHQWPNPQGKLVMCVSGEVLDVGVDIRRGSPTFGKHWSARLSEENGHQLWIPPGFAHGFQVLSPTATFVYLCTTEYDPAADHSLAWDDPSIGIEWESIPAELSAKDLAAPTLAEVDPYRLPEF